ncbi:MAG: PTS sugar transporter subunit IIA [Myxococcota bacterium]
MALAEYLEESRIAFGKPGDKEAALREVAGLLSTDTELDADACYDVLLEREAIQTTGVGSGVAVPHGRLAIDSVRAALVIVPGGVDFESIDGAPVHFVLGVLAPTQQPTKLLRLLAEAFRVLREQDRRTRLLACNTPQAILQELEA